MTQDDPGFPIRSPWGLEDGMIFLNHGSYGATPTQLLQEQRGWQDRMERQPVRFINGELPGALHDAAGRLADFVGTTPDSLAFVENTTAGIGAVLRSIPFRPGDVIVVTDHIYNAVRQTLAHVCSTTGASLRTVTLGLPVAGAAEVAARICDAIDGQTRLVCIDHVASASAVIMPVAEVAAHCRSLGVPLLVDGAHAPGMLDLNLSALDADYYVGNCHKWLCAPKGAAFLSVADRARVGLHPLVISHAYGAGFPAEFAMVGTRDASAQLTVPAAIRFHADLGGAALRARNRRIARAATTRLAARLDTVCGAPPEMFGAMATVALPPAVTGPGPWDRPQANAIKAQLWDDHRIEVHVMPVAGRLWLRFCVHAYNDAAQIDALADCLAALPHSRR